MSNRKGNTPNEIQRRLSSHRTPQPSLSPKQRALRDREQLAREVEELREHQVALKRAFYERRAAAASRNRASSDAHRKGRS